MNGKLKWVLIVAGIISIIIWVTATIADLHEAKRDLETSLKKAQFDAEVWKAKTDTLTDIGEYGEKAIIDTFYKWRIREIIKSDTILVLDTVEILRRAKFVEFDTSKTFAWARQSITIRAAGKLFTEPEYRNRNYLSIEPVKWVFEDPDPTPVIQFANLKTKFGIGLMMTNEVYGTYFRIGPTRMGVTSKYKNLDFGAYVGFEALSF